MVFKIMKFRFFLLPLLLLVLVSCQGHMKKWDDGYSSKNDREYQIGAYLWFQKSGEFRALCYQAYQLAKLRIEQDLEDKTNKKRAVIFDIDETVLDNSESGSREIKNNIAWKDELFINWIKEMKAIAIPGALEFAKYLDKNRIELIYISNRDISTKNETYINLKNLGFPVKLDNLLLGKTGMSKESRRQEILKNYHVALYIGDNLSDFHQRFDNIKMQERNALVEEWKEKFGVEFIILPNPLYGDWESALPKGHKKIELL